ncbi:MAG: urea transporter [Candidatus Bathyarchaeia archaeon]
MNTRNDYLHLALIGAAVAYILGASTELITFGLFGYNSILTGMAFWSGPFTKSTDNAAGTQLITAKSYRGAAHEDLFFMMRPSRF